MKLIDYMWKHDENKNLYVLRSGKIVATYDGRESIPEDLNESIVKDIYNSVSNGYVIVEIA